MSSSHAAYSAKAIANFFIELAQDKKGVLDPMKIQKLVYYAHGWSLALLGQPLIREPIEAWDYGPVIRSLYMEFRKYGKGQIIDFAKTHDAVREDDDITKALLRRIWELYGKYTGIQLSNLTHADGTPWQQAWTSSKYKTGISINNELIEGHFLDVITKDTDISDG